MAIQKRSIYLISFLYACLLTVALLVVRFPADTVRQYGAGAVERLLPGTRCSIGRITYDFPLTFRLKDIRVALKDQPEEVLFTGRNLSICIEPRKSSYRLAAEAYGGRHECRLLIKDQTLTLDDVKIHHFDLGQWGALQRLLGRKVSGFLDVTGTYTGRFGKLAAGETRGTMVVHEGSMELLQPILSLETIHYQDVETEFSLQNHTLTLSKGVLRGVEFNAAFAGIVRVAAPLGSSPLGLSGRLTPLLLAEIDPRLKKSAGILQADPKRVTLPFIISGTLAGPLFRVGG